MRLDKKTRKVWEQARTVLLAEHPQHDASEHVGLLSVMVGLRSVALFLDIDEPNATKVIRLVNALGLTAFTANDPTVAYTWESAHPPEITEVFRDRSLCKGMWVCQNRNDARLIRMGQHDQRQGAATNAPPIAASHDILAELGPAGGVRSDFVCFINVVPPLSAVATEMQRHIAK